MAEFDLSRLSFFTGFDEATLRSLGASGDRVDADAGAVLAVQGDVGREAFVVLSGEVEVIVNGQPVATAGPASILGEMALVDLRPRSATLVAATDCELLAFDADDFRAIVDKLPAEARDRLAERMAKLRDQNQRVADDTRPQNVE